MLIPDRVAPPIGEKRVTVRNLDWQAYQQLRSLLAHRTHARLTYDRGTLEITLPLEEHEFASEMIALFVRVLVTEMGLKLKSMGSTTLDREDLKRGAEPDKGFYIQNQQIVAGRTVDLATDPAPDLIVEVDITNTDIDKNELYANLGVPEFRRFDGREWRIYQLQEQTYVERDRPPTFPIVEKTDLYHFLEACQQDEIAAESDFRAWVRQKLAQS